MSSPNDIEVMIHYYTSRAAHPRSDAPAVSGAVIRFLDAGLLKPVEGGFEVTDGGKLFIETLCAVPWPVRQWVLPEKEHEHVWGYSSYDGQATPCHCGATPPLEWSERMRRGV